MTTGSIQSASLTLSKHVETYMQRLTLTNDAGTTLQVGEMVFANGDLTVDRIVDSTDDAEIPIGIVDVAGDDGENVTIATMFSRTLKAENGSGGALAAGDPVRPLGTFDGTSNLPEWTSATPDDFGPTTEVLGNWASGIVLSGGANGAEILVGILRAPIRPTPVVD